MQARLAAGGGGGFPRGWSAKGGGTEPPHHGVPRGRRWLGDQVFLRLRQNWKRRMPSERWGRFLRTQPGNGRYLGQAFRCLKLHRPATQDGRGGGDSEAAEEAVAKRGRS